MELPSPALTVCSTNWWTFLYSSSRPINGVRSLPVTLSRMMAFRNANKSSGTPSCVEATLVTFGVVCAFRPRLGRFETGEVTSSGDVSPISSFGLSLFPTRSRRLFSSWGALVADALGLAGVLAFATGFLAAFGSSSGSSCTASSVFFGVRDFLVDATCFSAAGACSIFPRGGAGVVSSSSASSFSASGVAMFFWVLVLRPRLVGFATGVSPFTLPVSSSGMFSFCESLCLVVFGLAGGVFFGWVERGTRFVVAVVAVAVAASDCSCLAGEPPKALSKSSYTAGLSKSLCAASLELERLASVERSGSRRVGRFSLALEGVGKGVKSAVCVSASSSGALSFLRFADLSPIAIAEMHSGEYWYGLEGAYRRIFRRWRRGWRRV